jgi:hypothetical protein
MTPSQARMAVWKGQGPPGIDRIDPAHLPGEQWHAHLGPGVGSVAINLDGTWRHLPAGRQPPKLTNSQRTFLRNAGWNV